MIERVFFRIAGLLGAPALLFFIGVQEASGQFLENPLKDINSIPQLIAAILDIVVQIGIPVVALFIIYSGFLFVKARGNPEGLKTAKTAFIWTLVGAAVLLGASVLASVISGTIDQLRGVRVQ